jgi:hypothetical protein
MRAAGLIAVMLFAGCSSAPSPPTPDPNAFEVDAKGAPAVVDQTLTLDGLGEPIGAILSLARCGDLLMFGDQMAQVRRMELSSGLTLPSIARDTSNMSMAADCEARLLYLLGDPWPKAARGQRQVQAINIDSGAAGRNIRINKLMMLPDPNATIAGSELVVGGTWMPFSNGEYQHPPIESYYSDKRFGVRVSLDSGEATPWLTPFELPCRGQCGFSTLARLGRPEPAEWLATQASSKEIAFYDAAGLVRKRFDISSPLFLDDGSVLRKPGGEPDMRWKSRNSAVKSADQFGEIVATVHQRPRLPAGYVFGQDVDFDYWMNLHAMDGRRLVSDIKLPGMPIGRDETHIYVPDYGPDGSQSSPDKLKILRIPVKAGTEGFRR